VITVFITRRAPPSADTHVGNLFSLDCEAWPACLPARPPATRRQAPLGNRRLPGPHLYRCHLFLSSRHRQCEWYMPRWSLQQAAGWIVWRL
jgi:hypothetical protein